MQPLRHDINGGLSREIRINIVQGSCRVTDNDDVVMSTVLGSCVACCLFDPLARVGGMNHFLLAEPREGTVCSTAEAERYGLYAMELLINEMLQAGAIRSRLWAHLYGGANLHAGMQAIGTSNADFARAFLLRDGIPLAHSNLGGVLARRVDFRATAGKARCRLVAADVPDVTRSPVLPRGGGAVELF